VAGPSSQPETASKHAHKEQLYSIALRPENNLAFLREGS